MNIYMFKDVEIEVLNEEVRECLEVGFSDEGSCFDSMNEWLEHELNIIILEKALWLEECELICVRIESYSEEGWEITLFYEDDECETIIY